MRSTRSRRRTPAKRRARRVDRLAGRSTAAPTAGRVDRTKEWTSPARARVDTMGAMKPASTPREAVHYLSNARGILRRVPVEREVYVDRKPVREAMGTAYLAVLEAINQARTRRGVSKRELPRSVDAYRVALQRHLGIRNGKLMREFESLYDLLHIAGYYRGLLYDRKVVRDALDAAERFIETIT